MRTGKATFPIHDLPDFEEVSSIIQRPKNKYQARCRMYANLMLHAGLRIGETQYKHQIVKNSINVEFQRIYHDNSVQTAKTQGLVVLPNWLLEEYKIWKVDVSTHRTLRDWMWTYFGYGKNGIGFHLERMAKRRVLKQYERGIDYFILYPFGHLGFTAVTFLDKEQLIPKRVQT